jgi:hypothetical protein
VKMTSARVVQAYDLAYLNNQPPPVRRAR